MVDGDGLENRCPSLKDRGFESHPLRHFEAKFDKDAFLKGLQKRGLFRFC